MKSNICRHYSDNITNICTNLHDTPNAVLMQEAFMALVSSNGLDEFQLIPPKNVGKLSVHKQCMPLALTVPMCFADQVVATWPVLASLGENIINVSLLDRKIVRQAQYAVLVVLTEAR